MEINGGSYFNFVNNLQRSFKDDDKDYFVDNNKNYEYKMILPNLKNLLLFSILDYFLLFGIFLSIFFKFYLDFTKKYRFKRSNKKLKKLLKKKKKYGSFNKFRKLFFLCEVYYINFDPYTLISSHKNLLFTQYIFKLPTIVYLLTKKYSLIDKKFFIIYYFIFFMISILILKYLIRIYRFLKINSISLFPEIMITKNKEYNWYLVFYQYIFLLLNLLNLFLVFIFKYMPFIFFGLTIISFFFQIIIIWIFKKKKLFYYILFETFTLFSFLLWIIFVALDKIFYLNFNLILNICYITSNVSKLTALIVLQVILYKIKKKSEIKSNK